MSGLDLVSNLCSFDNQSPPLPSSVDNGSDLKLSASPESDLQDSTLHHPQSTATLITAVPATADCTSTDLASVDSTLIDSTIIDSTEADAAPIAISPERYFTVLEELAQTRALECQHIRRICQLEKALDQALIYLDELKVKVRNHDDLVSQLSITEDFAYVQHHAIARLKLQISEQKQMLMAQDRETQEYDDTVQRVLRQSEQLAEYQKVELEHLKARLVRDQMGEKQRQHRLEKQVEMLQTSLTTHQEQMRKLEADALAARTLTASLEVQLAASQQQVRDLSTRLAEAQTHTMALSEQVKEAQALNAENTALQDKVQRSQGVIAEQNHKIATLERDVALAEANAAQLDAERLRYLKDQARWQQRCQELDAECDRHRSRTVQLEQQAADMQEDILRQTRQAGEYEATVQVWKERYRSSQRQLTQLKALIEREAPHLSSAMAEDLLHAVQLAMVSDEDDPAPPSAIPTPQFNTVDMPEFLIRRYAFRNRGLPSRDRAHWPSNGSSSAILAASDRSSRGSSNGQSLDGKTSEQECSNGRSPNDLVSNDPANPASNDPALNDPALNGPS